MSSKEPRRLPSVRVYEVVVGIDYSSASAQALQAALDMVRKRTGSHLHVVAIAEGYAPDRPEELSAEAKEAFLEEAKETLNRFIDDELQKQSQLVNRKSIQAIVDFGDPADKILAIARELNANLIVVGTHGKGMLEQMLMGSVSTRVLREAHCSVLVVRGEGTA